MRTFFISSTGTEIGKTIVTTILLRQIRMANKSVEAIKPIITGFDENNFYKTDTAMILNELGREVTKDNIDQISPWRFKDPISPNLDAVLRPLSTTSTAIIFTPSMGMLWKNSRWPVKFWVLASKHSRIDHITTLQLVQQGV